MGEVFLARQRGIEGFARDVVIKQIHANYADDPEFVKMFLQEARIAALLDHPNIVQIFELGKKDRHYFIVMEYVEGLSLSRLLRAAGGSLPLWAAVQIACGVAQGLHFAHNKKDRGVPLNLVHRDVSPPNILLATSGSVKLTDFGIAKVRWSVTQTQTGMVKGKYYYISPEHARGEPVDRRADIYALGLVLYEMTTGRRAYEADNDIDVLRAAASGAITAPSDVAPSYPRDLERIVLRALARDPEQRQSECNELQEQLSTLLMKRNEVVTPSKLGQFVAGLVEQERVLREGQPREGQPREEPREPRRQEPREEQREEPREVPPRAVETETDIGAPTVVDASKIPVELPALEGQPETDAAEDRTEIDNVFELETLLLHAQPDPQAPEAPPGRRLPFADALLPPGYGADEEATKLDTRLPPLEEPPRVDPETAPVARASTDEVRPPPRLRLIWPVFVVAMTIVAAAAGGVTWCLLAP
jgi:hypothetical protein